MGVACGVSREVRSRKNTHQSVKVLNSRKWVHLTRREGGDEKTCTYIVGERGQIYVGEVSELEKK